MASSAVRRSGRRRAAAPKYTTDAFDVAGLDLGSSESERFGPEEEETSEPPDDLKVRGRGARRRTRQMDEDEYHEADDVEENDVDGLGDEDDVESAFGSDVERDNKRRKVQSRRIRQIDEQDALATHSRGLYKPAHHGAKATHLKLTFGASDEDLLPMIYARNRWSKGRDATFPSSDTLRTTLSMSTDEMAAALGVSGDMLRKEATSGWDWYYDENIGGKFRKKQRVETITADEGQTYLPKPNTKKHTVLLGPASSQKAFELGVGESLDFGKAWSGIKRKVKKKGRPKKGGRQARETDDAQEPQHAEAEQSSGGDEDSTTPPRKTREGWILNLGNKVQCLSWTPNCAGTTQYLAIVVPVSESQKQPLEDISSQGAPAFTPSPPYPCAIQIWSFGSTKEEDDVRQLYMAVKPRLHQVICTDAGDIRRLSWCPMGRDKREEDETDEEVNIGLLAGIWGDGTVKVLDVRLKKMSDETEYVQVHVPAFEAKPPSTLCTCFCWLSPCDLAVGTASGFVGVWSLSSPDAGELEVNPVPYIYVLVHTSYLLNVATSYPSHPHILLTTGMDGRTKLFSLLDPQADVVEVTRSRFVSFEVSYSPFLRTYICSDDTEYIRLQPLRRFFSTSSVLQTYDIVSALTSANLCHPSFLTGNVGGTVTVTNPLRRLLNAKEKSWQQTWFTHEWVPRKKGANGIEQKDTTVGPGASKFYDGFKAEIPKLARKLTGDKRIVDGNLTVSIFEEGTAITALAWNPNKQCAGWASAGMGCGLVRVEDVALR
ncbi:hypothetical protein AJ79_00934 [Helicocarpus griseus UAMH5409]|uniref:Uncharacterized protein n=1 Tax=Helicocarpus griseus UAMH5409 TaxID=1447875 RepID=A0A2B7Y9S7_9EURO|nr:hypothetical protein AJ79_00934 [Helicocarpus griseus UAMH5409]